MKAGPWVRNKPNETGLTPRTKELWKQTQPLRDALDREPIFLYKITVRELLRRTE